MLISDQGEQGNNESESENDDEDVTNGEVSENADPKIRRILTKSRLVHDIDAALDLQNYDRFDIPESQKKTLEL